MAIFVVQAADGGPAALERARFVRDGFSWPAFAFAQLWLLFHRLWLALALWIAGEVVFLLLVAPHLPVGAAFAVDLAARLWLGAEASRLRLAKGARGATLVDVIEARDRDEAAAAFFRAHLGLPAATAPAATPP